LPNPPKVEKADAATRAVVRISPRGPDRILTIDSSPGRLYRLAVPLKLVDKKLPETPDTQLTRARDRLIESAGKISANMLGMVSKVGGQIYALLFLARSPMSLDDVVETLHLSKGNVSVNIRMLEDCGLVRKVWVKGTRKDYYEAARDHPRKLLKDFFDRVRSGIDDSLRLINRFNTEFEGAAKTCEADEKEDANFMVMQLFLLKAFYEAASGMFEDFYQGRKVDMDLLRRVILEE
jgi:DNA-binding transcriptional regulator GbsR (MarR family)